MKTFLILSEVRECPDAGIACEVCKTALSATSGTHPFYGGFSVSLLTKLGEESIVLLHRTVVCLPAHHQEWPHTVCCFYTVCSPARITLSAGPMRPLMETL